MKEWGLVSKKGDLSVARSSKYSHLEQEIRTRMESGAKLFDIADELGIPRGSIAFVIAQFGLTGLQIQSRGSYHTKQGIKEGQKKRRKPDYRGEKHHFHGLVALRGKWVTREEFIAEAKKLLEQDMTYAQMMQELGVSQATLWARLKEAELLPGLRNGDRAPMWRGGNHSKWRGPSWQQRRKEALNRDNYTCQDCGKTNAQELKERGKQLSVHHIIPYEISHDSELGNLVALCNSCHMRRECNEGRFSKKQVDRYVRQGVST